MGLRRLIVHDLWIRTLTESFLVIAINLLVHLQSVTICPDYLDLLGDPERHLRLTPGSLLPLWRAPFHLPEHPFPAAKPRAALEPPAVELVLLAVPAPDHLRQTVSSSVHAGVPDPETAVRGDSDPADRTAVRAGAAAAVSHSHTHSTGVEVSAVPAAGTQQTRAL